MFDFVDSQISLTAFGLLNGDLILKKSKTSISISEAKLLSLLSNSLEHSATAWAMISKEIPFVAMGLFLIL